MMFENIFIHNEKSEKFVALFDNNVIKVFKFILETYKLKHVLQIRLVKSC